MEHFDSMKCITHGYLRKFALFLCMYFFPFRIFLKISACVFQLFSSPTDKFRCYMHEKRILCLKNLDTNTGEKLCMLEDFCVIDVFVIFNGENNLK